MSLRNNRMFAVRYLHNGMWLRDASGIFFNFYCFWNAGVTAGSKFMLHVVVHFTMPIATTCTTTMHSTPVHVCNITP